MLQLLPPAINLQSVENFECVITRAENNVPGLFFGGALDIRSIQNSYTFYKISNRLSPISWRIF